MRLGETTRKGGSSGCGSDCECAASRRRVQNHSKSRHLREKGLRRQINAMSQASACIKDATSPIGVFKDEGQKTQIKGKIEAQKR